MLEQINAGDPRLEPLLNGVLAQPGALDDYSVFFASLSHGYSVVFAARADEAEGHILVYRDGAAFMAFRNATFAKAVGFCSAVADLLSNTPSKDEADFAMAQVQASGKAKLFQSSVSKQ